ncbi:hypothetical protein BH23ACT6_BH23ACT6_02810 [soil metagenome]
MLGDSNVTLDGEWLSVPEIMDVTGASQGTVRTWLADRDVIGMRRGPHHALMVPIAFVTEEGPLKSLRGTVSVLGDSGLSDDEIIEWFGRPDDSLAGGSPIGGLLAGHKTEVRRRAMELAL